MPEHSKILTKLLDDLKDRPSEVNAKDIADLSMTELAIYMKFFNKQSQKHNKDEYGSDKFKVKVPGH